MKRVKARATTFAVGDVVRSRVTAQNLIAGAAYRVVDVRTEWTPSGGFVTYVVEPLPGYAGHKGIGPYGPRPYQVHVINGHLILSKEPT